MDQKSDDLQQSIAETRHDMEETRASMTEKLELIEERVRETIEGTKSAVEDIVENVKGTVDETVVAVKETVDGAKSTVEDIVENVKGTMDDTVTMVKQSFDFRYQVQQHPWLMLGGSVIVGNVLGGLLGGGSRDRTYSSYDYDQNNFYAEPHAADKTSGSGPYTISGEQGSMESPATQGYSSGRTYSRRSWASGLSQFHDEFDMIKGVIVGVIAGTLREMIRQNMPRVAPQLEQALTSASQKLGAEPIPPAHDQEHGDNGQTEAGKHSPANATPTTGAPYASQGEPRRMR